jgi:hypothetical protein
MISINSGVAPFRENVQNAYVRPHCDDPLPAWAASKSADEREDPFGIRGNAMPLEFESEQERQHHQATAKHLAREMHVPEKRVLEAYALELEQLQQAARVKQFLSVLAVKHVKARLNGKER